MTIQAMLVRQDLQDLHRLQCKDLPDLQESLGTLACKVTQARRAPLDFQVGTCLQPVSYTHLTLPTILLV